VAALSLPLCLLVGVGDAAAYLVPLSGVLAILAAPVVGTRPLRAAAEAQWVGAALCAAGQAGAIAILLCGGLSLLLLGADALFGASLAGDGLREIWRIGPTLLLPWLALALLPRSEPVRPLLALPRWPRLLLSALLAPLALAFATLLNAYCLFILVRGDMPKGVVGPMVLAYALCGGALWSLTFGSGRQGSAGRILRRLFLPGLAAPSAALLVATWTRAEQHGITEYRYLVLLLGALLLCMAGLQLATRRVPAPSRVAVMAVALLLAASVGPWGATAVTVRSQLDRLEHLLAGVGHFRDGSVYQDGPAVANDKATEIGNVVLYLVERGERQAIVRRLRLPATAGGPDESDPPAQAESIAYAMGIDFRYRPIEKLVVLRTPDDGPLRIGGFDDLIRRHFRAGDVHLVTLPGGTLRLEMSHSGRALDVGRGGSLLCRFDLGPLLAEGAPDGVRELDAVAADGTRLRVHFDSALGYRSSSGGWLAEADLELLIAERAGSALSRGPR
jgi:hypothetical protein